MNLTVAVAAQDDRFLAHARNEKVSGFLDQGFVADEQPHPGEYLFQLFGIDPIVDENLPADAAVFCIDHLVVVRH